MKMDAPRRKIVSDAVDLLTTDYEEQEATVLPADQIVDINTDCIVHYHNHLFHLYEGERLDDLVQSIQDNGVLTPVIVMRLDEENYEMLAGHNRLEAAKLAGLKRIPAIIKEKLSEQEALAYVVETNLRQRSFSDMYPSEQAAVLKVQYSQILSQGRRSDIIRELDALDGGESTSDQIDQRLDSRGRLAKEYNLSPSSIARLIRVFELIEPYKRAMDNKKITMQIAINLSYLSKAAQGWVLDKSEKLGYRLDAKASAEFRSQPIAVHCRGKSKWVRCVVASVLIVYLRCKIVKPTVVLCAPLAFASAFVVCRVACPSKACCNASGVAVFALMQAAGDWVPGAIAPLYLCFFHCLSSSYGLGRLQPQLTPPFHSVRK